MSSSEQHIKMYFSQPNNMQKFKLMGAFTSLGKDQIDQSSVVSELLFFSSLILRFRNPLRFSALLVCFGSNLGVKKDPELI